MYVSINICKQDFSITVNKFFYGHKFKMFTFYILLETIATDNVC